MEIVGTLLKSFKSEFQPIFMQSFKEMYLHIFTKPQPTTKELVSAICIFDDYSEHTHDLMWENGKSPLIE